MRNLFKKAAALGIGAMMIFSLSSVSFASVDKDKTASELENDRTAVSLSVGADQEKTASDVVFVLDKSTSVDVRDAAVAMLEELKERAGDHTIKVGVVIFNRNANRTLELTELNEENFEAIEQAIRTEMSSGTNIDAGIRAGKAMLDADSSVSADAKHLVLVTDGVTYLWGDTPTSIYSEVIFYGEEKITAGNDMFSQHHSDESGYADSFRNAAQWLAEKGDGIQADTDEYEQGQYSADVLGQQENSVYSCGKKFIPGETLAEHYCANDAAVYMAGKAWQSVVSAGYSGYAYADQRYASVYPWAPAFIEGLSTIGGISGPVPESAAGMFDQVKSDILYTIQKGSVTDVIGEDFDLEEGSFTLTVGGQTVSGQADDENPNRINFGTADENGVYPYTVEYFAGDDTIKEQFKWEINVPVEQGSQLVLSYSLKLVNKATEPGTYRVPTNESAVLDYTGTDGTEGSELFDVPYVEYTVEETETPPVPTYYTVIYNDGVENEVVFEDQTYAGLTYGVLTPEFQGTPVREGYTFVGWDPAVADRVTGNAVYKAIWEKDEEPPSSVYYTVIYNDGVENEVVFEDQTYAGLTYGVLTPEFQGTPVREGYTFAGWEPAVADRVTGNAVYKAIWEKDEEPPIEPDDPQEPPQTEEPGDEEDPVSPVNPAEPTETEKVSEDIPKTGDSGLELVLYLSLLLTAGGLTVCAVKLKKDR